MKTMYWYNEPDSWSQESEHLTIQVTPKTDYWRQTHYGFTVDDGPFYFQNIGGEFEMTVTIQGEYKSRFDQMGLMLRIDQTNWIKFGVEYLENHINISAVVTRDKSDWSMIKLQNIPSEVELKMIRRIDAVELLYRINSQSEYSLMRLAYFPEINPVKVGMMAASPDGEGFKAVFNNFKVKHLPDLRRENWLNQNK